MGILDKLQKAHGAYQNAARYRLPDDFSAIKDGQLLNYIVSDPQLRANLNEVMERVRDENTPLPTPREVFKLLQSLFACETVARHALEKFTVPEKMQQCLSNHESIFGTWINTTVEALAGEALHFAASNMNLLADRFLYLAVMLYDIPLVYAMSKLAGKDGKKNEWACLIFDINMIWKERYGFTPIHGSQTCHTIPQSMPQFTQMVSMTIDNDRMWLEAVMQRTLQEALDAFKFNVTRCKSSSFHASSTNTVEQYQRICIDMGPRHVTSASNVPEYVRQMVSAARNSVV